MGAKRGFIQFLPMIALGIAAIGTFVVLNVMGKPQDIRGRAASTFDHCDYIAGKTAPEPDCYYGQDKIITCIGRSEANCKLVAAGARLRTGDKPLCSNCVAVEKTPSPASTITPIAGCPSARPTCPNNQHPLCLGSTWVCPAVSPTISPALTSTTAPTSPVNQCDKGDRYCVNLTHEATCKPDKSGYTTTLCTVGWICDTTQKRCMPPTTTFSPTVTITLTTTPDLSNHPCTYGGIGGKCSLQSACSNPSINWHAGLCGTGWGCCIVPTPTGTVSVTPSVPQPCLSCVLGTCIETYIAGCSTSANTCSVKGAACSGAKCEASKGQYASIIASCPTTALCNSAYGVWSCPTPSPTKSGPEEQTAAPKPSLSPTAIPTLTQTPPPPTSSPTQTPAVDQCPHDVWPVANDGAINEIIQGPSTPDGWTHHNYPQAIDIGASFAPIVAVNSGTVSIGEDACYGKFIKIHSSCNGSSYYSYYGHLSVIGVSNGQTVTAGQVIGVSGNSGSCSSGTHLHFQFTTTGSAPRVQKSYLRRDIPVGCISVWHCNQM